MGDIPDEFFCWLAVVMTVFTMIALAACYFVVTQLGPAVISQAVENPEIATFLVILALVIFVEWDYFYPDPKPPPPPRPPPKYDGPRDYFNGGPEVMMYPRRGGGSNGGNGGSIMGSAFHNQNDMWGPPPPPRYGYAKYNRGGIWSGGDDDNHYF